MFFGSSLSGIKEAFWCVRGKTFVVLSRRLTFIASGQISLFYIRSSCRTHCTSRHFHLVVLTQVATAHLQEATSNATAPILRTHTHTPFHPLIWHPGILSSLSCPALKHRLDGKPSCNRGDLCNIFRAAAVPGVTRLRASSGGRQVALPPCGTPLAPADLDILAQKHEQAQVCLAVFLRVSVSLPWAVVFSP